MSAPPMFSTTPPPTLPSTELPPSPVNLSGVANPNLPDVEPAVQEDWNDTKVEETALELMREAFESSSTSQPSSSSDASPSTTHPTSSSSHRLPTTFPNRPPQPVTPPRRFSAQLPTLSSVDTRDPSARTSQNEVRDRLERDLNGQGRARRVMNEPEGKGDDVEGDKSWNGGERKEVLSWRGEGGGNSAAGGSRGG